MRYFFLLGAGLEGVQTSVPPLERQDVPCELALLLRCGSSLGETQHVSRPAKTSGSKVSSVLRFHIAGYMDFIAPPFGHSICIIHCYST